MFAGYTLKLPTWFISHPYAVLFIICMLLAGVYIICRPRISRKADDGDQGKHPLGKIVIYFYILTAMAIVALIVNLIHR